MKCVILAGGVGLRLWPLSRKQYPKQFLALTQKHTMFEETVLRNQQFTDDFMILTNDEFRFVVERQMEAFDIASYEMLLETIGRNTAPAITLASLRSKGEELLFVVPADAKIENDTDYRSAVEQAQALALDGAIVTFGIDPTTPHTGYGYIRYSGNDVLEFKEKPDKETAKQYLADGGYLWNSGMFLFRADVFLAEIEKYRDDIYKACKAMNESLSENLVVVLREELMKRIPSESVDYAVMEHSDRIKVVPSFFSWNDIGGLEALCKDRTAGNMCENTIVSDCSGVSVINEAEAQLVVANGLDDVLIVNTNDAVYVSKYGRSSDIKKIIEENSSDYGHFFNENIRNYRPWGFYEVLINHTGYKVKRLTIYPHQRLSLQKHLYRTEHWTIVSGTPDITIGTETKRYSANQGAYIAIGQLHRISNNTDENVEIIEIAIGQVISEDDIIRVEDDFNRISG